MSSTQRTNLDPDLKLTKNSYGYMHKKSWIMDQFIEFSKTCQKPVLDIGAAYGVATLKCLENGAKVIACDMCEEHLQLLSERTSEIYKHNLHTLCARFPEETNFNNESINAVLISHVLPFLTSDEIELAMKKIYDWLCYDGKLFILSYTPYHKTLASFIPIYEKRVSDNEKWPGFIADKTQFTNIPELLEKLPNRINLMDMSTLRRVAEENSFSVDWLHYIGGRDQGVPEIFCLDGREWVGMIATKV